MKGVDFTQLHRPQKVFGHLLQGELRGEHQIRNAEILRDKR